VARVYVGIGSNVGRDINIRSGVAALRATFGHLILSSVYKTKAVGFDGDDFYNLVAGFDTHADARRVAGQLRDIERRHGRVRLPHGGVTSRTLDIDMLLYDDLVIDEEGLTLPRSEIQRYAFVLGPLAEIASERRHPVLGLTYGELWDALRATAGPLMPVRFRWE
jgi:2-amino-4-hydroxy-6-hydroxymethyldihydropteridine diphosphokinase